MLRSSLSDAEVETLTLEGDEHGFAHYARPELKQKVRLGIMYRVKYQLEVRQFLSCLKDQCTYLGTYRR